MRILFSGFRWRKDRAFLLLLAMFCLVFPVHATSLGIGVITDGDTPKIRSQISSILAETRAVMGPGVQVAIPEGAQVYTDWDEAAVGEAYDKLQKRNDVDVILAIGALSAPMVAGSGHFPKPVVAYGITDPLLEGVPVSEKGTSGKKNLTYFLPSLSFAEDIAAFRRVVPVKRVGVVVDAKVWARMPGKKPLERFVPDGDFTLVPIPVATEKVDFGKFPEHLDGLILAGLYRFPESFRMRLIREASRRRIPTFSLVGEGDVHKGAMMGVTPKDEEQQVLRLIALRIEAIAAGRDIGAFPVREKWESKLYLNLATARAVGVSPPWDVLTEAELVAEPDSGHGLFVDLSDVAKESLAQHTAVRRAQEVYRRKVADLGVARSSRRPAFAAEASGAWIDEDRAVAGTAEKTTQVTGSLTQVIYSDGANTQVYTGKRDLDAALSALKEAKLDAVLDVGTAYFGVLRARTLLRIRKETVSRTRKNLEIARQRKSVGYSGRADVLRWETELARARQELIASGVEVETAKNGLKRRLGWDLDMGITLADATLEDRFFITEEEVRMGEQLRDPRSLRVFSRFLETEAANIRPEVLQISAAIAKAERNWTYRKRKRMLPEVALQASAGHVLDRSGEGAAIDLPSDNSWNVGVSASWTLFSGGAISAEREGAYADLRNLRIEKEETLRQVGEEVRNRLNDLVAAAFDIQFSRQAAEASRENLALVEDAYAKGEVSIVEVMDARDADIQTRESAAQTVYAYLLGQMKLGRAIGLYTTLQDPAERAAFLQRYEQFRETDKTTW